MTPVYAKVAVSRHGAVILIGSRRAQGQSQGIGIVRCVQGHVHAIRRVLRLDPVIGGVYTGGIVHPVVGNP